MEPESQETGPSGAAGRHRGGSGAPAGRRQLELVTLAHVAGLVVFTTWNFGGETDLARNAISWWGSLAVLITAGVCIHRIAEHHPLPSALRWLWPLAAFDALVLAAALNPSFTLTVVGGADAFVLGGAKAWWPSCARPATALRHLWLFNAIYLTCFNLALVVVHRRVLRALLSLVTVNALLLAIFGTFQKLAGAPGLYFGRQPSPNPTFFASFIYHNHWGAFMVLSVAGALALMFYHARPEARAGRRHSPALVGLVAVLFMAAAVPLSGSRSGGILVLLLLLGAFLDWLRRDRRAGGRPPMISAAAAMLVLLVALGGIFMLGRPVIEERVADTRGQLEQIRRQGGLGSRAQLYRDTWRMARAKIWFGWGLGSYATVFQTFNQQVSVEHWVPFYAEAHSDWLQALAETGAIGALCLMLTGVVPLAALRGLGPPRALTAYPLAGCALVVLYALVEFPLANPAVLEVFWLCLFTAVRYQKLSAAAA